MNAPERTLTILMLAGASSVHTMRWANELAGRGHRIVVASASDHAGPSSGYHHRVSMLKLPFPSLSGIGYYLNANRVRQIDKSIRPDVVSVHYASGYGTLARIARLRCTVLSVWGSDVYEFPDRSSAHRKLVRKNLAYADRLASTSETMAVRVREIYKSADPTVTPFGVDLERFEGLRQSTRSEDVVRVIITKSLKPIYGLDIAIRAISMANATLSGGGAPTRLELSIYGEGAARQELSDLAVAHGMDPDLVLPGVVTGERVLDLLGRADIAVVPSLQESFGVAAVEAMAARVPLVVSDAPGLLEVTMQGKGAHVFKRGSAMSLSKILVALALDRELRGAKTETAHAIVSERYRFSENASTLEELLLSVARVLEA